MQYKILTTTVLLAAVSAQDYSLAAGGSQEAPGPSESIEPYPTVGMTVTGSEGSTYIAPLPPTPTTATVPLTYPLLNSSSVYPTGTAPGGGSSGGNLSTTYGSKTSTEGGAGSSSGAVVTLTTTGEGGEAITQTSVVGVEPSATTGAGGDANPTGSTQPGSGSQIQAGAAAALAAVFGVGALLL